MCVLFSTCSLLSKEQGVTVLGVCAGYDIFLNWELLWRAFFETCKNKRKRKNSEETVVLAESAQLIERVDATDKPNQVMNGDPPTKIVSINNHRKGKNKSAIDESKDSPLIGAILSRIGASLQLLHGVFHV